EAHHPSSHREEDYYLLVRNLPDMGIILFDRDINFLIAEGPVFETQGYSNGKLARKSLREVVKARSHDVLLPRFQATLQGQHSQIYFSHEGADYDVRFVPLIDAQNEIKRGMVIVSDITEIRQFEDVLQ